MSESSVKKPLEPADDTPRCVKLTVSHVDPWSVMKVGFLLSVALGIILVVVTVILWFMLDSMHVFGNIEQFLKDLQAQRLMKLLDYVRLPKVISYATIVAVANVVILTALATLGGILYNVIASLVGGIRVSLMDD